MTVHYVAYDHHTNQSTCVRARIIFVDRDRQTVDLTLRADGDRIPHDAYVRGVPADTSGALCTWHATFDCPEAPTAHS